MNKKLPKRDQQAETEAASIRIFDFLCPRQWIPRDLTGRDYGIDKAIEIFHGENPTGGVLFFQIKGTSKPFNLNANGDLSFSHKVKNLNYANLFSVPVILLYCDTTFDSQERKDWYKMVRFVWLQEYYMLEYVSQGKDIKGNSITIKFPETNIFDSQGLKKLELIAQIQSIKDRTGAAFASAIELESFYSEIESQDFENINLLIELVQKLQSKLESITKILPDYTGLAIYNFEIPQQYIENLKAVCSKIINEGIRTPDMFWVPLHISSLGEPPRIDRLKEHLADSIRDITDKIKFLFQFIFDPTTRHSKYNHLEIIQKDLKGYKGY